MRLSKLAVNLLGASGLRLAVSTATTSHGASLSAASIGSAATAQAGFGTIKGRLVWGGETAPSREKPKADKDVAVCGKVPLFSQKLIIDPKTKGVAFAFAYLERIPRGRTPRPRSALPGEGAQGRPRPGQLREFVPYSVTAMKGQKLGTKSSDPVGHNARYSGFTAGTKNIALPPQRLVHGGQAGHRVGRPYTVNFRTFIPG